MQYVLMIEEVATRSNYRRTPIVIYYSDGHYTAPSPFSLDSLWSLQGVFDMEGEGRYEDETE